MFQYDKFVIIFLLLNFIGFKTLKVQYLKTTCPIELKLAGLIVLVNKSLYIEFQVILKFYKNIGIFNFKDHRYLLWSCNHAYKLKELKALLI